jgi:hypothetical protein
VTVGAERALALNHARPRALSQRDHIRDAEGAGRAER